MTAWIGLLCIVVAESAIVVWVWRAFGSYSDLSDAFIRGKSSARPKFWRWILGLPNPWHTPPHNEN